MGVGVNWAEDEEMPILTKGSDSIHIQKKEHKKLFKNIYKQTAKI